MICFEESFVRSLGDKALNSMFFFTKHDLICVAWYDFGIIIRNLEECFMIRYDIFWKIRELINEIVCIGLGLAVSK